MRRSTAGCLAVAVALALVVVLPARAVPAQGSRVKALVGGTLIDGYGGAPLRNSVIIVDGDRIRAVGQVGTLPVPADAEVISTEGMTVLPGLWDMHVHLRQSLAHPDRLAYFQMTPARRPTLVRKFRQLQASGVVLLIGTDSGIPMKFHCCSTWNELDTWVNRLGVDPMVAIRAATYWPAVAMKVDRDVGTVSPGKFADIIAVRGDALRYISLLQHVDLVVKHRVRYK